MTREAVTAWAAAAGLAAAGLEVAATGAVAAERGTIPIERDLRRWDRVEESVELTAPVRRPERLFPPDPSGVTGFSGPPGIVGDSVDSYGPLPPGAPGNEE